jgi:outer membrane protein OmpU
MKKVLLASTALVLSAGIAAAEVSVGGDGRMGIIDNFTGDIGFTSRIRISFSASGETDGGLAFGGSIRADNSGAGTAGTAGSVFAEGAFGKISMGDVAGAPEAAVGDVSGVGLTGLGDHNEMVYLSNADRSAMRYDYTTGSLGLHVSADNPVNAGTQAYGVAVTYAMGDISFGLGYEDSGVLDTDHIIAGVSAGFGDATVKAVFGSASGAIDGDQFGISLDYVFGATTVTVYYADKEELGSTEAYGIGASYDLGGGASLKGGFVQNETADTDGFDFGLSMKF